MATQENKVIDSGLFYRIDLESDDARELYCSGEHVFDITSNEVDFIRVRYLLAVNKIGSGDLFRICKWVTELGEDGKKIFTGYFDKGRGFHGGIIKCLTESKKLTECVYELGVNTAKLEEAFKDVEKMVGRGLDGDNFRELSLSQAKEALANYYYVDAEQVTITITSASAKQPDK